MVGAAILLSGGGDDEETRPPHAGPEGRAERGGGGQELYEGIPQHGIDLGDRRRPATLVEIADLQCPFCAQYSTHRAGRSVVRDYVRTGRVRYELRFRSFLGRDSVRAAGAAA